jgi:hypothetical protein
MMRPSLRKYAQGGQLGSSDQMGLVSCFSKAVTQLRGVNRILCAMMLFIKPVM